MIHCISVICVVVDVVDPDTCRMQALAPYPRAFYVLSPTQQQSEAGPYLLDLATTMNSLPVWRQEFGPNTLFLNSTNPNIWVAGLLGPTVGNAAGIRSTGQPGYPHEISGWQTLSNGAWSQAPSDFAVTLNAPYPVSLFVASPNYQKDKCGVYQIYEQGGHMENLPVYQQAGGVNSIYSSSGFWVIGPLSGGNTIKSTNSSSSVLPELATYQAYDTATTLLRLDSQLSVQLKPPEFPATVYVTSVSQPSAAGRYDLNLDESFVNGFPVWDQATGSSNKIYSSVDGHWELGIPSTPGIPAQTLLRSSIQHALMMPNFTQSWLSVNPHGGALTLDISAAVSNSSAAPESLYVQTAGVSLGVSGQYNIDWPLTVENNKTVWQQIGSDNVLFLGSNGQWQIAPSIGAAPVAQSHGLLASQASSPDLFSGSWQMNNASAGWRPVSLTVQSFENVGPFPDTLYVTTTAPSSSAAVNSAVDIYVRNPQLNLHGYPVYMSSNTSSLLIYTDSNEKWSLAAPATSVPVLQAMLTHTSIPQSSMFPTLGAFGVYNPSTSTALAEPVLYVSPVPPPCQSPTFLAQPGLDISTCNNLLVGQSCWVACDPAQNYVGSGARYVCSALGQLTLAGTGSSCRLAAAGTQAIATVVSASLSIKGLADPAAFMADPSYSGLLMTSLALLSKQGGLTGSAVTLNLTLLDTLTFSPSYTAVKPTYKYSFDLVDQIVVDFTIKAGVQLVV